MPTIIGYPLANSYGLHQVPMHKYAKITSVCVVNKHIFLYAQVNLGEHVNVIKPIVERKFAVLKTGDEVPEPLTKFSLSKEGYSLMHITRYEPLGTVANLEDAKEAAYHVFEIVTSTKNIPRNHPIMGETG